MRGMRGIPKRWSHAVLSLATWPCAALCRTMHCKLRKTSWDHYYLWNYAHKTDYFIITLFDSSVKLSVFNRQQLVYMSNRDTISLCNVGNQASHLNQICYFKFVPPPFFGCIGRNTLLSPWGCSQIWCIAILFYPLHCTLLECRQWQNAVCAGYHAPPSFSLKWPCAESVQHVPDLQLPRHILARMARLIPVQYLL